jgi:serine/threonine protein phosphatase PrpC
MITAYPDVVVDNLSDDVEFIILACDGIWDCMTNQEACDFVSSKLKTNPNIKLSKIIEEMFDTIVATDLYSGNIYINYF